MVRVWRFSPGRPDASCRRNQAREPALVPWPGSGAYRSSESGRREGGDQGGQLQEISKGTWKEPNAERGEGRRPGGGALSVPGRRSVPGSLVGLGGSLGFVCPSDGTPGPACLRRRKHEGHHERQIPQKGEGGSENRFRPIILRRDSFRDSVLPGPTSYFWSATASGCSCSAPAAPFRAVRTRASTSLASRVR